MYRYEDLKPRLFTDESQRDFLKVRDAAEKLLSLAGAFRFAEVLHESGVTGDSWLMLAYVDRLVELGEIRDLDASGDRPAQFRVFVRQ